MNYLSAIEQITDNNPELGAVLISTMRIGTNVLLAHPRAANNAFCMSCHWNFSIMSDLNAAVGVDARTHPDGLADGPSKIARGIAFA